MCYFFFLGLSPLLIPSASTTSASLSGSPASCGGPGTNGGGGGGGGSSPTGTVEPNAFRLSGHTIDKATKAKVTLENYYSNLISQHRERKNRYDFF